MCQLGELLSSIASNPQAMQQLMGGGGGGMGGMAGMGAMAGIEGMNGMPSMPSMPSMGAAGPAVGGGAVDPQMMVAIMDPNSLPMMDPALFQQLSQMQGSSAGAAAAAAPTTPAPPAQPVYNITLIDPAMLGGQTQFKPMGVASQLQVCV